MTVIIKVNWSDHVYEFHNVIAVHQSATELTLVYDKSDPFVVEVSTICFFLILPN